MPSPLSRGQLAGARQACRPGRRPVGQPRQLVERQAHGRSFAGAARHDRALKPELGRLLQPRLGMADGAHLAGQADLAEDTPHRAAPGGRVSGGDERRRHRQVGRRLADPQAAGDVQIDIAAANPSPQRASSTASSMASRPPSQPTTARRGVPSRRARPAPGSRPAPAACPPCRRRPPRRRRRLAARRGTGPTDWPPRHEARPRPSRTRRSRRSAPKRFLTARRMRN